MSVVRKVWHINNIASVGPTLVEEMRKLGVETRFIDVPKPLARAPTLFKIFGLHIRIAFARKILREAREQGVQLLHVHFTTAAPLFLFGGIPVVVHAHGSDARIGWTSLIRHALNFVACRYAAAIFYATPDMEKFMRRYTTRAQFSPNPMDIKAFAPPDVLHKPNLIFLNAALDPIKGADIALKAIKILKNKYPQLHFQTIRLGRYIRTADNLGVEMLPRARREDLPKIVGKAGLILGQFRVGAIGMSELEVLAIGRTVACHFEYASVYPEPPPFIQAQTVEDIVTAVDQYVANERAFVALDLRARAWVEKFHSSAMVAEQMLKSYAAILSSASQSLDPNSRRSLPEHS